jgi:glycosyltransferase involved in cell wall biosynthesis
MKVLQCIETLNPQFGGVVESVIQTSRALARLGVTVEILNLDDPSSEWGRDIGVAVHRMGPTKTFYKYSARMGPWLGANARRFDSILINGLWRYHSVGARLALRNISMPYYVVAHCALNPWLNRGLTLKQLRKTAFWWAAEWKTLRDAAAVIYCCEDERLLAGHAYGLYRCREAIVPLGTADPGPRDCNVLAAHPELRGKQLFLFLGRLHPMKACDQLLQSFASVAASSPDTHLVMAGPDTEGWRAELVGLAEELGIARRVTWTGALDPDERWGFFRAAEALVLPSHCESTGYVAIEALACGTPVLVSNQVNIHRSLLEDHCAIVNEDTVDGTTRSFREWLSMSEGAKLEMRKNARRCFLSRYEADCAALALMRFLASESARGCVRNRSQQEYSEHQFNNGSRGLRPANGLVNPTRSRHP